MQQVNYSHRDEVQVSNISQFLFFSLFVRTRKLNSWNDDVESDTVIESSLRSLFEVGCLEYCRLQLLSDINEMLKCAEVQNLLRRDRQAKMDLSTKDDLFMPARGRWLEGWAPPQIMVEKKAMLDLLGSDLFVPKRGRRQMTRKNFPRTGLNPFIRKRNGIEHSEQKDYFVPNRGKRQRNGDELLSDNFFSLSGKKVIIPKSHTPFERYPSDPWLFQNINSDDRNMIDRLQDLSQLGIEVETKTTT